MRRIIIIYEGGCIQDIQGIPPDVEVEVRSYLGKDDDEGDYDPEMVQVDANGDKFTSHISTEG